MLAHTISMVTTACTTIIDEGCPFFNSIEQSTPLCNTSDEVTLLDIDTGENTHLQGSNNTVQANVISLKLPTNRRYNITVMSNNAVSYTTSSESHVLQMHMITYVLTPLGTHDILGAIASQTDRKVTVTSVYFDHSTASGALFSFVFITDSGDVDFSRSFLLALDRNTSHNHTLPFDLYPGHYRVHAYMTLNMMEHSTMEWDTQKGSLLA